MMIRFVQSNEGEGAVGEQVNEGIDRIKLSVSWSLLKPGGGTVLHCNILSNFFNNKNVFKNETEVKTNLIENYDILFHAKYNWKSLKRGGGIIFWAYYQNWPKKKF